MSGAANYRYPV